MSTHSLLRPDRLAIAAFGLIAVLVTIDVLGDWHAGTSTAHLAIEVLVIAVAGTAVALLGIRGRRRVQELTTDLEVTRARAEQYRAEAREALRGLGEAIEEQLRRWELTDAEREVALLLLKGMSLKEIATARGTSERTVRQQAQAVYRKAGLSSRSELSAFFLDDLWLPRGDAAAEG